MSDPAETVRSFIAACEANDLDQILGCFVDDAVYHNVPLQPVPRSSCATAASRRGATTST